MSNTDRDLLALAAKAAGKSRAEWDYDWLMANGHDVARDMLWDPRRDSGQALELAAKLGMRVDFNYYTGTEERPGVGVWTQGDNSPYPPFWTANARDHIAHVRLTIFRAAVELGRAMP